MRLTSLTLLALFLAITLIIILPAQFLQITSSYVPDEQQKQIGGILAGISTFTGRPSTSASVYDFLILHHPHSVEFYLLKFESLLAAGDNQGALRTIDAALLLEPENPIFFNKKARILINMGKVSEGEKILDQIISIRTNNPQFVSVIADINLEKGKYLQAYDMYNRILQVLPDSGIIFEKRSDVIFALLTLPTAGINASVELKQKDLYSEGMTGYKRTISLMPERYQIVMNKIEKRSAEYTPKSIEELESRYPTFKYLEPEKKQNPVTFNSQ